MARCKLGGTHSGGKPSGDRQYEIQQIQDWHREAMRLIVLGWKNTELAAHFGCSKETICSIRNSSIVKRLVDIMQAVRDGQTLTPEAKLKSMVLPGLNILDDIMKDDTTPRSLRASIVFGVADRTGLGPTKKIEGRHAVAVYDEATHEELMRRKKAAIDEGIIVEVEEVV